MAEREEVLREAIVMTLNRLEAAVLGDQAACKHCIDVAASYLQEALASPAQSDGRDDKELEQ